MIRNLVDRIGWELIAHRDYTYWGGKRAVVLRILARLPPSVQLLRAARLLDAMAAPRPGQAGQEILPPAAIRAWS
ncbi:MAG: hypothetical protein U1E77_11590 [Inhella sp.]